MSTNEIHWLWNQIKQILKKISFLKVKEKASGHLKDSFQKGTLIIACLSSKYTSLPDK